jgi:hypothetical protein
MLLFVVNVLFHVLCMSVDCIVADDNPLLDFISIKINLLHLITKWYSFSISNLHIGQSLFSKGIFWWRPCWIKKCAVREISYLRAMQNNLNIWVTFILVYLYCICYKFVIVFDRDEVNLLHSITKWYSFSISNLHIGQSLFSKGIFWWRPCSIYTSKIRLLFNKFGFCHVWENQNTFSKNKLLKAVYNKLSDNFISYWKRELYNDEVTTLFSQKITITNPQFDKVRYNIFLNIQ